MKKAIFTALFAVICQLLAAQESDDRTLSPYFLVTHAGSSTESLPLKATSAEVRIAGVIADVMVSQMYVNTGKKPIEAVYVFPGSTRAAVYGMGMQIGNRVIKAKIAEKQKAREQYEQAKTDGKRASLLEQERPNVFQMNVANIMPGDTIRVLLQYTELLVPENGRYQFVYPTVVGPRYVSDAEKHTTGFTATPYTHQGQAPSYTFDLHIRLAAGMPLQEVFSSTHKTKTTLDGLTIADISLDPAEKSGGNRDFILQYALKGNQISTGLLLFDDGQEKYFLCMAQPPKRFEKAQIPPREYIFVIDVSGSMTGFPLEVSKTLLRNLVGGLHPQDQFNIVLFAGDSRIWSPQSLAATPAHIDQAIQFLEKENGGGGTQLLPALKTALQMPRQTDGLSRSILLVTDGYISAENEAFQLIRENLHQSNLFAFGIGSSVNRFLMEGLAHTGQGTPFIVTDEREAGAVAEKFRQYVASPVMTGITAHFEGFDAYDVEPISIPDVMADRPVIIFGKWRGAATGKIRLEGYTGEQETGWSNVFSSVKNWISGKRAGNKISIDVQVAGVQPQTSNAALKFLWAREKIKNLSDYGGNGNDENRIATVTQLGLQYNLLTAYTSFLAIEEIKVNGNAKGLEKVKQPLPLPVGVSDMAVGFDLSIEGISGATAGTAGTRIPFVTIAVVFVLAMVFAGRFRRKGIRQWLAVMVPVWLLITGSSCGQTYTYSDCNEVTFLLGEDRSDRNRYFDCAEDYFNSDSLEKTPLVVTGCPTMLDVRNYLDLHRPRTGAWRRINLVVHGNEWTGVNVPLTADIPRTSAPYLRQAVQQGIFRPLPGNVIDPWTEMVIYGCNVGRDSQLLYQLSAAFGGEKQMGPVVRSARYFNLFQKDAKNQGQVKRFLADCKSVPVKAGQFPGNKVIAQQLHAKYPKDTINWIAALTRLKPRFAGDSYVHYFHIPVQWTTVCAPGETFPNLHTATDTLRWVYGQKDLLQTIRTMGFEPEQFRWEITPSTYTPKDAPAQPAILTKGLTIIYGVIEPLPVKTPVTDERYYAVAQR